MVDKGSEPVGRVTIDVKISNAEDRILAERGHLPTEQIRTTTIRGIIDTRTAMLVLPEAVAQQLGLSQSGEATVRYPNHQTVNRTIVEGVEVEILGRRNTFTAVVEPDRTEARIGVIVLGALDMLVDCQTKTLHPRDPDRIIAEI